MLEPKVFGDGDGFLESFNAGAFFRGDGVATAFVRDNHSRSARGVLRGLHYQLSPGPRANWFERSSPDGVRRRCRPAAKFALVRPLGRHRALR